MRDVLREHRRRALRRRRRDGGRPARRAGPTPPLRRLLAGYRFDVSSPTSRSRRARRHRLAAAARAAARDPAARRVAARAPRAARPGRGLLRARARAPPRRGRPARAARGAQADALLAIQAPADPRELVAVDPALIARVARARRQLREATMRRRWCSTLWPTPALAEQAGMAQDVYAAFVTRALFLDQPDPVAAWGGLGAFQERLIARLAGARELRIEAEGTDLRLRVQGRTWVNSDARNMPSGEVFTGPHEASAEGNVRFTVRSSPAGVDDVEPSSWSCAPARSSQRGRAPATTTCSARWPPTTGAWRLGEVGIGTNFGIDRPVGTILRREDRRDRAPRPRPLVPRDGRQERLGPAPDLRPAGRGPADGRRRGDPAGRAVRGLRRPERLRAPRCAARRSSPPSGRPRAIVTCWCGWSRPGWTSPG